MTAEIVDFAEAKAKILGRGTVEEPKTVNAELSNALEQFSFSRLSKEERIERSLRLALFNAGYDTEDSVKIINLTHELASYLPDDVFMKLIPKARNAT